jgi:hypothetical protein
MIRGSPDTNMVPEVRDATELAGKGGGELGVNKLHNVVGVTAIGAVELGWRPKEDAEGSVGTRVDSREDKRDVRGPGVGALGNFVGFGIGGEDGYIIGGT